MQRPARHYSRYSEWSRKIARIRTYQRLYEDLRSAVEDGRYKGGEQLPTEQALTASYGVSRQTVRRAFQDLVTQGLVYRVPGRGTFATGLSTRGHYLRSVGTVEDLLAWAGTEMELLSSPASTPVQHDASLLKLPDPLVTALTVRRFYHGEPFVLTRISLPPDLGHMLEKSGTLPERGKGTVIGTLEQISSHRVAGASQNITPAPCPADLAGYIDCQAEEPILRAERLYYDTQGQPIELAVSHYNPRRYSYRLELRRKTSY